MAAGGNPIPNNHVMASASENFSELQYNAGVFNLLDQMPWTPKYDHPPNSQRYKDPIYTVNN